MRRHVAWLAPGRATLAATAAAVALHAAACAGPASSDGAALAADAAATDASDGVAADGAGDVGDDAAGDAGAAAGGPRARVYLHDPSTDLGQTTEVSLVPPVSTDGSLHGPYANVWNCLNQAGGPKIRYGKIEVGAFCLEQQTAKAGADGHYLHITPPADSSDPNDAFAEVQMYHHVHAMHAFFKERFGLTAVDYAIDSLVNVNLYIDPKIAATAGLAPGWQDFPNAAFVPKEGFAAFNLPDRKADAIIFGQTGTSDLAYDASVIYHEYTHAMIGTTRLASMLPDAYGLDHMPGAMNEAFADYFACSKTNHPVVGAYGIAFAGAHRIRDLSVPRRCPQDLTGEIHADGRVLSSALWRVRQQVGADRTDAVVLRALQQFTKSTSLAGATKLILAEAGAEDDAMRAAFEAAFDDHGLRPCERIVPWQDWKVEDSVDKVAYRLLGKAKFGGGSGSFADGVPGHLQHVVALPANAKAVTLRWQASAPGFFSQPALAIAVQPATPPTLNLFAGGKIEARAVLPMSPDPNDIAWQGVTLVGKCLSGAAGKVFVMPLNQANVDAEVTRLELKVHTSVPAGPNVRTCD